MLKIGDFSKFTRVSIKTLRYYDEIGLLKPVAVDKFNGYRYYSADQIPRLNRIAGLKDLGLSLEEISVLLKGNLPLDKIIELLKARQHETLERVREEEARLKKVEEWLEKVEKEGIMPETDVVIKKIEPVQIASIRETIPGYGDIGRLYGELYSYLGKKRVQPAGPPLAIYHDHEYREKNTDVEAAVPVTGVVPGTDKVKIRQLPEIETAACIIHRGPYDQFNRTYTALMAWVEAHGYRITGPNREIYLQVADQTQNSSPQENITEIQLPVAKEG